MDEYICSMPQRQKTVWRAVHIHGRPTEVKAKGGPAQQCTDDLKGALYHDYRRLYLTPANVTMAIGKRGAPQRRSLCYLHLERTWQAGCVSTWNGDAFGKSHCT